ncbi:MAG: hypothetical protein FJ272_05015, partial [Planctomycetes bacterium]|nr:hypothetical protein [Planctomycetota bacterium]
MFTDHLSFGAAFLLGLFCLTARAVAAEGGWLNARECGASGSKFETTASTTAGSKDIVVKDVGDFKVGQGVMVSKCHPRITKQAIWGPRKVMGWEQKLDGKAEIRGYNGDQSDWLVLMLDVPQGSKTFRWTEDFARTWHPTVSITGDWQLLRDGIEVRFNAHDWESGHTVVFAARGQLVTTIEKVAGNVVTLRDAPTRSAPDAVLRHCDDAALQAAINRAIQEKRHVYVPVGHYRLSRGLYVRDPAGLTIQGANAVHTVLDISEGEGACITLANGVEATLRDFTMVGHSGFEARDQCGAISMRGSSYFWGFAAKNCNAVTVSGTERVLIENCHGVRMASECFVSGCPSRGKTKANQRYSQAVTYLRCSATDCGRNAFNDVVCGPENTSVLYCRIVDVGGCAWEGASRFVKFVGNYVRNAGTVAMGNLGTYNRDETYPDLGAGQHIIADNVFESIVPYGGCAIRSAVGATQVIIRNNLFINFGSSAVEASGATDSTHYPSSNTTIAGNIFDMTCVGGKSASRTAIDVSANDTIVSGNQIYVRGPYDSAVTAIRLREPAHNAAIHDNLIRNCGVGIVTARGEGRISEVVDAQTFLRADWPAGLPLERKNPDWCRGWGIAWLADKSVSVIAAFDPQTLRFRLREPRAMKPGDRFEVIAPSANWNVHHNTITGCVQPVLLDSYGSETSFFKENVVTRGEAAGVKAAIEVRGRFHLIGNHISGFDEKDCAALALFADPFGRV